MTENNEIRRTSSKKTAKSKPVGREVKDRTGPAATEIAELALAHAVAPQFAVSGEGAPAELPENESDQLTRVLDLLHAGTNCDFRGHRRPMLMRRVQRRMGLNHIDRLPDYIAFLQDNKNEARCLLQDLLISVTGFFRDPEAYQMLAQRVVAQWVERNTGAPIRIWVPGCATGEEVYSIAMLAHERFSAARKPLHMQIFATDIDSNALEIARQGIYPESIAAGIPAERLTQFFTHSGGRFQVKTELRESIVFAFQNLLSDAPFSKLDLISCRNLLIYLKPELQRKVVSLFHFALHEGGHLFLGSSETTGRQPDLFEPVSKKCAIFRRTGAIRRDTAYFPILPHCNRTGDIEPWPESAERRRPSRYAELTQRQLLNDYAPASALINHSYEVLYLHGRTGDFLEPAAVEPAQNLTAIARPGLRTKLRTACQQAIRNRQPVVDASPRVKRNGVWRPCTITIKPIPELRRTEGLLLITFVDRDSSVPAPKPVNASVLESRLKYELNATREDLQLTIDLMEGSHEDLKVSNEEVISINEELQAANEELEASKEELQSLNEELNSSNIQLQEKVKELDKANDDIKNLLNSTDIAALFLDKRMRIRQFTPAARTLLGLTAADAGRAISTFSTGLTGEDLLASAREVLRTRIPAEVELWQRKNEEHQEKSRKPKTDGPDQRPALIAFRCENLIPDYSRCYLRRILPYRTARHRVEGVVVTFMDITQRRMAEEVLRESEERMRQVIEFLPGGAVYVRNNQITMNRAAERITGYQRDELPTLDAWFSSLYGERGQKIRRIHESDSESSFPRRFGQLEITRKDGQQRLIEFAAYKFDGRQVWLVLDVTTRRQAEEILRFSEERLSLLIRAAGYGIWDCDIAQRSVWLDDTYHRMFGSPLETDDSWKWWIDHIHPEDRWRVVDNVKSLVEGDAEGFEVEYRSRRIDGSYADVRNRGCIIRNELGHATRILGSITDITERKKAQQALRESEERMRSVLDAVIDAIVTVDRHGIINSVNPATLQMFGYTQDELVGKNISILMPQPYRDEHDGYIERYLQTGEARIIGIGREATALRKDGSTFPVDLAISAINQLGLFTGMIRDISYRKELQRQVLDSAAEEDRRIAHELHDGVQQEITGLEMFAATLLQRLDSAERRKIKGREVRRIEETGFLGIRGTAAEICKGLASTHGHLQQLCRGILPVPIDSQGLAAALAELAASTSALRHITCNFECREVIEVADNTTATHLFRIAQEAVNNALRHSRSDAIRIALGRRADQLILEISDNGIGIDAAVSNLVTLAGATRGIGLRTMRYRASLIDARLQIGPGEKGGTQVRCMTRQ